MGRMERAPKSGGKSLSGLPSGEAERKDSSWQGLRPFQLKSLLPCRENEAM